MKAKRYLFVGCLIIITPFLWFIEGLILLLTFIDDKARDLIDNLISKN
jgi:hypothetical protein